MRRKTLNRHSRNEFLLAAAWDLAVTLLAILLLLALVGYAKADYVVCFSASWCGPCQQMRPVEEKLRGEGYDLRPVDIDQRPDLKLAYRIVRVPTFVYVAETSPTGNYELGRLSGLQSEATLRQFCQPRRVLYDAAPVANVVRSLLGLPILVWGY